MRKFILAGNWKMNTILPESVALTRAISKEVAKINLDANKFEIIVAPPFINLYAVKAVLNNKIGLSAQNIAAWENGAYTGETSASMVASIDAKYAILGHSERRQYFGENSQILNDKLALAFKHKLTPIFCIGEKLDEREAGEHFTIIKRQISETLFMLDQENFKKVIIAYEPVWAIGTGKNATPEQAQEVHSFIRKLIENRYNLEIAESTSILYGGSCKPSNAESLFIQPDIDGGLIGGASIVSADFITLINQLIKAKS